MYISLAQKLPLRLIKFYQICYWNHRSLLVYLFLLFVVVESSQSCAAKRSVCLKYDEFRGVEAATWGHCCLDSLTMV